jgi:hypothetical protein
MNLAKRLALAGLVVTTLGFAQSPITQTLPPGFDNVATGTTDTQPFGVTYAEDVGHPRDRDCTSSTASSRPCSPTSRCSASIRYAFRVPAGTGLGATTSFVDVWMTTTTPLEITTLSNTFTNNHGVDRTQVFSGSITWPAAAQSPPRASG